MLTGMLRLASAEYAGQAAAVHAKRSARPVPTSNSQWLLPSDSERLVGALVEWRQIPSTCSLRIELPKNCQFLEFSLQAFKTNPLVIAFRTKSSNAPTVHHAEPEAVALGVPAPAPAPRARTRTLVPTPEPCAFAQGTHGHAKNKIARRFILFLVLGFWDKNTGICAGAMPYRQDFPDTTGI